jgi:hypothetical protein
MDLQKTLNNFERLLKDPEVIARMREKHRKDRRAERLRNVRIKRFHNEYGDKLDLVIERLIAKYDSKAYCEREYKRGREPRQPFFWFLFEYARQYCQPCHDKKYHNSFTGAAFYIGSYVIQVMYGQGSAVIVEKQEEPIYFQPRKPRFNADADNIEDAVVYIKNRAVQLIKFGYKLTDIKTYEWGVDATFIKDGKEYQTIYLLESFRGKGLYKSLVNKTILTSDDCDIRWYLVENEIDHVSVVLIVTDEYQTITNYYGDSKAERSGVFKMNHIDEGLAILEWIGASETAKKAYCLHPIYQSDEDLAKNADAFYIDTDVLIRVIEYRSVANECLSNREIMSCFDIRLSPLKDVNDMLIADKIQNRKDFELYHKGKHQRSKELDRYFIKWCQRLGITEEQYQDYKNQLING